MRWFLLLRYSARDIRHQWRMLALVGVSTIIGLATSMAVGSFARQLILQLQKDTRAVLGADVVLTKNAPFDDTLLQKIDTLAARRATVVSFTTMARCQDSTRVRLAQVRAISADFPLYGAFQTTPVGGRHLLNDSHSALIDDALQAQLRCATGENIELGKIAFPVVGSLQNAPGDSLFQSFIAPRLYVPLATLDATGLIRFGSRVKYEHYLSLADDSPAAALDALRQLGQRFQFDVKTSDEQTASITRVISRVEFALRLVALALLIVSCLGMTASAQLFFRDGKESFAVLRALGLRNREVLAVVLLELGATFLCGAIVSGVTAVFASHILSEAVSPLMTSTQTLRFPWRAMLTSVGIFLAFAGLFLTPIIREVLAQSFRNTITEKTSRSWTAFRLLYYFIGLLSLVFITVLWTLQPPSFVAALIICGVAAGLAAGFAILALGSRRLIAGITQMFAHFAARQAGRNLFRPDNVAFTISSLCGFGVAAAALVVILTGSIEQEIRQVAMGSRANLVLFDIQEDQRSSVRNLLTSSNAEIFEDAPIVSMRVKKRNGVVVSEILNSSADENPYYLQREYRSTYRAGQKSAEEIIAGTWFALGDGERTPVPISIEQRIAESLKLSVGSRLSLDVQGLEIEAIVQSIRRVDWQRMEPNFYMVFPPGVLEDAPQSFILTTSFPDVEQTARFLELLAESFPNVSSIDARTIIASVDHFLGRISGIVSFVALFSVFGSALIVWCVLLATAQERVREAEILKKLGSRKRQIREVFFFEYGLLGLSAALCGVLVGIPVATLAATQLLRLTPHFPWLSLLLIVLGTVGLVVVLGVLSSAKVYRYRASAGRSA